MNITQENQDALNAVIHLEIAPEDYQEKVQKVLKDHRKKAQMPGFRPGMVPMGMVKKMYGKSVLFDEINKIISNELYKFIDDQKLEVLGAPLPAEDNDKVDFEDGKQFHFKFEIGLAPEFKVGLSEKDKFDYYKIDIDKTLIDRYSKDFRKRYGKIAEVDVAGEEDMLGVTFTELEKDGTAKENGINHASTIALEFVEDEKSKKALVGIKVGDTAEVDPAKVSKGDADMAAMLGVKQKQLAHISKKFQIKVDKIYNITMADENQELYDKVFGPGQVSSKEEYDEKIKGILYDRLAVDMDKKLTKDVADKLIERLKLGLPDDFLKRWLLQSNEGKFTAEQIEEEYDDYSKDIRWQLIESKIVSENSLEVKPEEALEKSKELFRSQMAQYGQNDVDEETATNAAREILGKEENARHIYQEVMNAKMLQLFKEKLSLKEKVVTFDEFVKIAAGKTPKNVFDKLSNLVKF